MHIMAYQNCRKRAQLLMLGVTTLFYGFSAKSLVAQRQKLIKMADASELGWRVVNEYVANPLASDSEDEKRMYKAEARASRKLKAERSKKSKRPRTWPYGKQQPPKQGYEQSGAASTASAQPTRRQPGLCFACGKPGHWKGSPECSANNSNNKISIDNDVFSHVVGSHLEKSNYENANFELCKIQTERSNTTPKVVNTEVVGVVSPMGRLKKCIEKWKQATNNRYILNVVQNGYRLPLKEFPDKVCLKNNKSARDNMSFVRKEVKCLQEKGVVSRSDEVPFVVNPLTVAYNKKGKPRLVLDCRHINDCLHLFRIKFEDIKVAEAIFDENTYLYTWDLASAYHHVSIFSKDRSLLGFSIPDLEGNILYYVFNALPFGIKTAGHIFTKLLKVVVSYLRANGNKVIMFLDDGIGGHTDLDLAYQSSQYTKQTLIDFGFLLAHEKCNWVPSRQVTWLGHMIDMEKNLLFISDERIKRLLAKLDSVLYQVRSDQYNVISVRVVASVTGQIISLQSVIGNKVRLRTRELFKCISARASWNAPVRVSETALSELEFWKANLNSLNKEGKPLKEKEVCLYNIFADASAVGYGGYVECNWNNMFHLQREDSQSKVSLQNDRLLVQEQNIDSPGVKNTMSVLGFSEKDHLSPSEMGFICKELSPDAVIALDTTLNKQSTVSTCALSLNTVVSDNIGRSSETTNVQPNAPKGCDYVKSYGALKEGSEVLGDWNEHEQRKSSTWREAEAVSRVLRSHAGVLRNSMVKIYSDNQNVKSVLSNGSSKQDIQDISLSLNVFCEKENITMQPEWIPRGENDKADMLSRCKDSDDWEVSYEVFLSLNTIWGEYTVDRFASHMNNKCKKFNSRWWVPGTDAVDAMTQFWGRDINWLVPPPRLIAKCLKKMFLEKAQGTLIIPSWKSGPFWPCLLDKDGSFKSCIMHVKNLGRTNVIARGKGNNGIFAKDPLSFDMLALNIRH